MDQNLELDAGSTLLAYRVTPPQVYVSSTVSLVVTISNPIDGQPVVFGTHDEIQIQFPATNSDDPLTTTLPTQVTVSTSSFTCALSPGTSYYLVQPFGFGGVTLQPGDSFTITFANVVIDANTGSPSLTFQEYIGSDSGSTSIVVEKIALALSVVAWLQQLVVGLNQYTTLWWQSAGNNGVMVSGFPDNNVDPNCPSSMRYPGQRCFPVSGSPPYTGDTQVNVGSTTDAQRTYTLTAYTSDGQQVTTTVTLTQHQPYIAGFGVPPAYTQPGAPLAAGASLSLQWKTWYGTSAWVANPANKTISRDLNPTAPMVVNPGLDAAAASGPPWTNIPASAVYTLNVTGFEHSATAQVTAQVLPPQVLYFKFMENTGGTLSVVGYSIDPNTWPAMNLNLSAQPYTLTVYQPGGTSTTLYLGSGDTTHPQVQYFAATSVQESQQTLSWVTANVTQLVLNPGAYLVPSSDIASGSYVVSPSETTHYVLTATAANGDVVTSTLTVAVG